MDWLSEHWPWIAAMLSIVVKFAQDHMRIAQHENRIDDLEEVLQGQQILQAKMKENIDHIRNTTDALADRQGITEQDIKEIIKNRN